MSTWVVSLCLSLFEEIKAIVVNCARTWESSRAEDEGVIMLPRVQPHLISLYDYVIRTVSLSVIMGENLAGAEDTARPLHPWWSMIATMIDRNILQSCRKIGQPPKLAVNAQYNWFLFSHWQATSPSFIHHFRSRRSQLMGQLRTQICETLENSARAFHHDVVITMPAWTSIHQTPFRKFVLFITSSSGCGGRRLGSRVPRSLSSKSVLLSFRPNASDASKPLHVYSTSSIGLRFVSWFIGCFAASRRSPIGLRFVSWFIGCFAASSVTFALNPKATELTACGSSAPGIFLMAFAGELCIWCVGAAPPAQDGAHNARPGSHRAQACEFKNVPVTCQS